MEQEVKLHGVVKTVRELTCLGDRVSTGGGCETAVTGRTRCWWLMFMECGMKLYGESCPLKLKRVVYKIYVTPINSA